MLYTSLAVNATLKCDFGWYYYNIYQLWYVSVKVLHWKEGLQHVHHIYG